MITDTYTEVLYFEGGEHHGEKLVTRAPLGVTPQEFVFSVPDQPDVWDFYVRTALVRPDRAVVFKFDRRRIDV